MCEILILAHIEMHSIFFGKVGVTEWYQSNVDCRT
jgi:hypothetical protein